MRFKDLIVGSLFHKNSNNIILYQKIEKIKKECGCGFYNAKNLSDGSLVNINEDSIISEYKHNEE